MKKVLFVVSIVVIAAMISSFKSESKTAPIINPTYEAVITNDAGQDITIHFLQWDMDGVAIKKCTDLATGEVLIENEVEIVSALYYFKCHCQACGNQWEQDCETDIRACVHCPQCDEKCGWAGCLWVCNQGYCERMRRL